MTETFQAEFRREGDPIFPQENIESENSTDSPSEKTDADQTDASHQDKKETDDKNGGVDERLFNHPRWVERENDWKKRYNEQEKRHLEDIENLRNEIRNSSQNQQPRSDVPKRVPEWFGGDESQWQEFLDWNNGLIGKAKEEARSEALKEIETKSAAQQKAIDEATDYFKEQVNLIESDPDLNPEGKKVDQNKLLKFVLDNELVDMQGRWNYKAGWRMMHSVSSEKPKPSEEKKKIASATTSDRNADVKAPSYKTSKDFQNPTNRPW